MKNLYLVEFLWGHVVDEFFTDNSVSLVRAIRGGFEELYDVRVTAWDGHVVARYNPESSYLRNAHLGWPATDPRLVHEFEAIR